MRGRGTTWVAVAAGAVFAALAAGIQLGRLARFEPRSFDLAIYAQILWSAGRGDFTSSVQQSHALAVHWCPLLLGLGPLARPFEPAATLVVLQSLLLGATGPLLFLALRPRLGERLALAWSVAALCYPPLWTLALADFHCVALGVAPGLLAAGALARDRPGVAVAVALLTGLLVQEVYPLVGLGLAAALPLARGRDRAPRRWTWAVLLGVGSLALFALESGWAMPRLRGGALDMNSLYRPLGDGPLQVALSPLLRPRAFAGTLLRPEVARFTAGLLLPLLLLPLVRPRLLLPALPVWLLHALSIRAAQQDLAFHYHAPLVPWLLLAGGLGVGALARRWAAARWLVLGPVLALPLAHLVPLPGFAPAAGPGPALAGLARPADPRVAVARGLLARIPEDAPVAASVDYLAALSARPELSGMPALVRGTRDWSQVPYARPGATAFVLADSGDLATFWHPLLPRPELVTRGAANWRQVALAPGRGVAEALEGLVLLGPETRPLLEEADLPGSPPREPLLVAARSLPGGGDGVQRLELVLTAPAGLAIPPIWIQCEYLAADGRVLRRASWPALYGLFDHTPWPGPALRVTAGLLRIAPAARLALVVPGSGRTGRPITVTLEPRRGP